MAAVTGNDSAATEHTEEPQLAELLNQEAGLTSEIELLSFTPKSLNIRTKPTMETK